MLATLFISQPFVTLQGSEGLWARFTKQEIQCGAFC